MRLAIISALCAFMLLAPPTARSEEPADAIRAVIENQLSAFQANDLDTAFSFATPVLQRKFGNPQNFGRMVSNGYPMVWRPRSHQMQQLVQTEAGPVQVVLFEDRAGALHEAGYLMEMIDGAWRINGVHVRRAPGVGT